ncbi:hypothetical protein SLE2022_153890 [Rubroshorea leprosula]
MAKQLLYSDVERGMNTGRFCWRGEIGFIYNRKEERVAGSHMPNQGYILTYDLRRWLARDIYDEFGAISNTSSIPPQNWGRVGELCGGLDLMVTARLLYRMVRVSQSIMGKVE